MSAGVLHLLCLRAAGRIPDGELAELRTLIIDGDEATCAARLLGAFPQAGEEITALAGLLPPGTPLPAPAADDDLDTAPVTPFIPFPPADLPYYRVSSPPVVDETAGGVVDDLDQALLEVLDLRRTTGVWRSWRLDLGPGDEASAVRVYLVETMESFDELPAVAVQGQRALAAAGHAALVEVFQPGLPLPAYQWAARSRSALIWAPWPPGEVRLAADGTASAPVDDDEILPFVTYLRSAPAVLSGLHTDGEWVWPATVADRLLAEAALADPGLLNHLRSRVGEPHAPADAVAVHRALASLVRAGAMP
ncbi:hypothetical protein [Actinoplanes derwentensis]|uniref:Uncharacterized protein n=1 Tax=Actinoplanes derwentensis TaxID=113562 RepID=A0A1H2BE95_9ACTN|nr:hypothetical protein [Actinoplanes derwentensis]GID89311.1 hypothetical protein Ade03nite_82350 [Actinoplanes derwentensis]SDT56474.1 hypothetical protein SAMN04489716_4544 [Actinoplanes derwentensis]